MPLLTETDRADLGTLLALAAIVLVCYLLERRTKRRRNTYN